MKYLSYLVVLMFFSCAKEKNYKLEANAEAASYEVQERLSENSYENILSEKLMNYVDLLRLKENHPNFKDDIIVQLKNLSEEQIIAIVHNSEEDIKEIQIFEPPKIISDSVKEFKLQYKLFSNSKSTEDSIFARITTHEMMLDNKVVQSNTIKFFSAKNKTN